MDTYTCMAESLGCSPETGTTLLIGYAPIQNAFGVKKKKRKKNVVMGSTRIYHTKGSKSGGKKTNTI